MRAITVLALAATLAACSRADEAIMPVVDPALPVKAVNAVGQASEAKPQEHPVERRRLPRGAFPEPKEPMMPRDGEPQQKQEVHQEGREERRRRHRHGHRDDEKRGGEVQPGELRHEGDEDREQPDGEGRPQRHHEDGKVGKRRSHSHSHSNSHSHSHSNEHAWGFRRHFRRGCAKKALGVGFLVSTVAAIVLAIKNRRLRHRLAELTAAAEAAQVPVTAKTVEEVVLV